MTSNDPVHRGLRRYATRAELVVKRIQEVEQGLLSGNVFKKNGMEEKNRMNADAAMPLDPIVTADCQRKMTYSEKSVKD